MKKDLALAQDKNNSHLLFEDLNQKYFGIINEEANFTKPIIRFFIGLFYSLGFILISIVLIQNLLYVWETFSISTFLVPNF